MSKEIQQNNQEYGADQIQILEGLEAVRKRPGMYIGSTSSRGLHHLVYEIVDNAVDEALAGYCKNIEVTIEEDNSITVQDDGRGIPVGTNHKAKKSALEVVFTVLHAGGKFGGGGYKVSGGLHGVGASVVNALSTWLTVEVYKDGNIYRQSYKRGKTDDTVKIVGQCDESLHGTKVHFLPDPEIFEETVYDYDTLKQRLRETAFLTKGLKITLKDVRENSHHNHVFHYEGGIKEFVEYLNRGKEALYDEVIYCEGTQNGVYVEVALQHNDSFNDSTFSFVNNVITPEGGTHLAGFRNALTKTFNAYAREKKILKDSDPALTGDDIREGLTAIISIKIDSLDGAGGVFAHPCRGPVHALPDRHLVFRQRGQHDGRPCGLDAAARPVRRAGGGPAGRHRHGPACVGTVFAQGHRCLVHRTGGLPLPAPGGLFLIEKIPGLFLGGNPLESQIK